MSNPTWYGGVDPEESKRRRGSHRANSLTLLREDGFEVEEKNIQPDGSAAHLIVTCGTQVADLWPGTGKWALRGHRRKGRGVRKLMKFLRPRP